VGPEPTTSGL